MIEGRDFVGVVPGKNLEVWLLHTKIAWKWMKAVLYCCKQCGSFGIRIRRQPNRSTPWSATSAEQFEHNKCCKSIQIIGRFTICRGRICGRAKPDKAARCNKPEDWEIEARSATECDGQWWPPMAPCLVLEFWEAKNDSKWKCVKCQVELYRSVSNCQVDWCRHIRSHMPMAPCRAWLRAVTDRRRVFSPSLANRSS